jgi:hypothetical protein
MKQERDKTFIFSKERLTQLQYDKDCLLEQVANMREEHGETEHRFKVL